jgi:KipI family sensor histidine kinase inhibitor
VGRSALLIECPGEVEAWRSLLAGRDIGATEVVPGAATVLLDGLVDPAATAALVEAWALPPATDQAEGPLVTIPVVYDGPDLDFVADHWSVSTEEAVARLSGTELRVAFCGFAPGFAYLTGLAGRAGPGAAAGPADAARRAGAVDEMPRLASPRSSVPAGSVGLAGPYAGIYPTASPGGWRLVGRTSTTLFDVRRDPPALLTPGTRVRLVAA